MRRCAGRIIIVQVWICQVLCWGGLRSFVTKNISIRLKSDSAPPPTNPISPEFARWKTIAERPISIPLPLALPHFQVCASRTPHQSQRKSAEMLAIGCVIAAQSSRNLWWMVLTMCGLACGCEGSLPLFSAAAREPLQQRGNADTNMSDISTDLQAQRWSPDCVSAAGKAR